MLIYLQTAKIPGTAARGRGAMPSSMGRLTTGQAGGEMARPMTAVRAAGYTSAGGRGLYNTTESWLYTDSMSVLDLQMF